MPLPNDPENRWWVEASEQNPTEADNLRHTLLALLAFGRGREPSLAGSAFVIGSGEGFALALTARHVLPGAVSTLQRPHVRHSPSALFIPPSRSEPSLDPRWLKAVWMGPRTAEMLNLAQVQYNDSLDISSFLVVPQQPGPHSFRPATILMDTADPKIGDVVHMVPNDRLSVEETRAPTDRDGEGQELRIGRTMSIRVGVVTGVYPNGYRQYGWPCFTTSIPARPGMSGGLVSVPRAGQTISACGVVSADNSAPEAYGSFLVCGESVIASTWPSLALSIPKTIGGGRVETATLHEMMRIGALPMAVGGIDHVEIRLIEDGITVLRRHKPS